MAKKENKKKGKDEEKQEGPGRPPTWTDPVVVKKLIDEYFENQQKPTLSGLAYALGIARSTLYEYEKKDEFSEIIKDARRRVEKLYEELLIYSGSHPTGVIFALKNFGWKDRQDITSDDEKLESPVPYLPAKDDE